MMIIIDIFIYLFCVIGSAILLNYSTLHSPIQDKIKKAILDLIARPSNSRGYGILQSIQESMACCGANGANDYSVNKHAILPQCRDAVTGSAYIYGCTERLATFLGEKTGWLSGIALLICALSVSTHSASGGP
ncbi:UNVERIFIED_CONTAM: hypothetical protein PYX00_005810 [Menopon gallinae]|uniref:Tetraspanin n=1 Tax=Menopon gallinae TaxID=328185 RepID=A0AAW2HSR0_9NEOP